MKDWNDLRAGLALVLVIIAAIMSFILGVDV